jgi:uncharacterized membrane protein YphA (DoxX/SURF4 family)
MPHEHHAVTPRAVPASSPLIELSRSDPRLRYLASSRIALGTLFLIRTTPLCNLFQFPFETDTWPLLGWPGGRWGGESWLHFPDTVLASACVARTLAAACFLLGVRARISGMLAGVLGYLVMLAQPFGAAFTLHLLFQGAIVLALGDSGTVLAWRPDAPIAPRSSVLLVRYFLASIYFWAGIAKLRPDWLDGRTLALFQDDGAFHGWASHVLLSTPAWRAVCATGVAVIELSLPVLLLWPRTQRLGLVVALTLHAGIELAARPDLLGWEMAALLLALWPARPAIEQPGPERIDYSHASAGSGHPMKP